jgi:DDE family transposase
LGVQATDWASRVEVTTDGPGVVGHAGAALLRELADRLGLTKPLGWQQAGARRRHPDAAVLGDLAVLLADGGDCLSDLAVLGDQPELVGPVASTPTAWRVLDRVARDADGLARLRAARAHARGRAWAAGGDPDLELLVIDADATLVPAHSDAKQGAAGTYKGSFGFAPLLAYLDRGAAPGEPLAGILRPGNAAPGAAEDLIELVDLALAQLPATQRPVLIRSDSAGGSGKLAWHLRQQGVGFTLGMPIDAHVREAILAQPEHAWTPAVQPDGQVRAGAEVVELTGFIDLHTWPEGTRALCRREDAHPGTQLRFTDHDGHRFQVFVTDQPDADSWPLSCDTASVPGSRTASAPPRPPACATCRSTCWAATPSGWSWSLPPPTSPAGHRPCCWPAGWPWPSPRRCATGCGTWPPGWSATPAA